MPHREVQRRVEALFGPALLVSEARDEQRGLVYLFAVRTRSGTGHVRAWRTPTSILTEVVHDRPDGERQFPSD